MNPRMMPLGDQAVLIKFEQQINPEIHRQVIGLASLIEQALIRGIIFVSPAYCSITVGYDPVALSYSELIRQLKKLSKKTIISDLGDLRKVTIPVCYHQKYAPDLEEVSRISGLSTEEVIAMHVEEVYRVYMLGFLPGFPYLGILPEKLQLPRKEKPSLSIPERSVAIAGKQTGIYPAESPGGWHILGRTPVPLLRLSGDYDFVFRTGDQVKFRAISEEEYQELADQVNKGKFNWSSIYE